MKKNNYCDNILNFLDFFKNKTILVCGGTGSIGFEIVSQLLKYDPKAIRVLSNSENELWESNLRLKEYEEKLRFLLGDIRDFERVKRAVKDVDYVFNAAAIKHVPFSEYNPIETMNVNVNGLENIIEACFIYDVKKLLHISTDKAVSPTSVMGATKMLGERLCISRELAKGSNITTISCVRFGNVLGSRGSIIPLIEKQIKNGNTVTLTDEKMRRFFMSISDAARLVLRSMILAQGGEIFVLKMFVIHIKDLLEVLIEIYAPKYGKNPNNINIKKIGSRPGEKLDEKLISPIELEFCYESDEMYVIFPSNFEHPSILEQKNFSKYEKIDKKQYSSMNEKVISKNEIREMLDKLNLI